MHLSIRQSDSWTFDVPAHTSDGRTWRVKGLRAADLAPYGRKADDIFLTWFDFSNVVRNAERTSLLTHRMN